MIITRHIFFTVISLFFFAGNIYAKEMIFYKYAEGDNNYSTFVVDRDSQIADHSAKFIIASNLMLHPFSLKQIPKSIYNVKKTENVLFFGHSLTQYEIKPKNKDRFTNVIWLDNEKRLFKLEIYDINKKLLLAFANVDLDDMPQIKPAKKHRNVNTPFYKGFIHMRTRVLPNDVIHLMFSDGVNSFSLFIDPNPIEDVKLMKIIYGNYLLSRVIDGIEYSIVGSVPYDTMDDMIDKVSKVKDRLMADLSKNRLLTDDILK